MTISQLISRAQRIYRTQGLMPAIEKSVRFVPRYVRHLLGIRGLYGSSRYRNVLYWWNSRPYSALADPLTVVHVDPDAITHVTERGPNPGRFQWQDIGTVRGGDWDQSDQRVEDLPVVQALRQRFENGAHWEEIEFIQHVIEQAERGIVIWRGCTNEADVWEACARVDELYENIRKHGYRTKRELVEEEGMSPDKYVDGDGFNRYDEIVVDIGRDGEFLFVDGRHRLAIAKILDIDEIPVRVSARHAQWQRIRERVAEADNLKELPESVTSQLDHPDLADLVDDNRNESK